MTMSMPGAARPTVNGPAPTKRTGLIRMITESQHAITIRPKDGEPQVVYCQARDRREVPKAKTVYICLHQVCSGKTWPSFRAMAEAHPEHHIMTRTQETHVFGLWSEDPIDPKDPSKGVIGLIAPPEPKVEEG